MTFDDIPLFQAVRKVYPEISGPRADQWLRDVDKRNELYRKIMNAYLDLGHVSGFPWNIEAVLAAWAAYGKQPKLEGSGERKIDLICSLFEQHHQKACFYAGRGQGACDTEVTVDRIKPGSEGGAYTVANCVLACQTHNSARGNRSLDEFLSGDAT